MFLSNSILATAASGGEARVGILTDLLELFAQLGIILFELVAVILMIVACLQTLYKFIEHKHHTVIALRKWMNVSLLFILCSEILRLVTVHSFSEVVVIFCIVLIHAAISVLSNWEMTRELKLYTQKLNAAEIEKLLNEREDASAAEMERLRRTHKNDINL
ncbi:MAG: DUF1622 domain-containing protein [Candidatus Heteroscillospira sp.]